MALGYDTADPAPMTTHAPDDADRIHAFLSGDAFAVVGVSTDRAKYGNKVLRNYLQAGRRVAAVHPRESVVEGVPCLPSVDALPEGIHGLSVVTPPAVAVDIVEAAARKGIRHVWFQPGASSETAVVRARELGLNCLADGPCLLVALRFRDG